MTYTAKPLCRARPPYSPQDSPKSSPKSTVSHKPELSPSSFISECSRCGQSSEQHSINQEIAENYGRMKNDSSLSDFTFVVQGITFKIHKAILAASSSVFFKLFTTEMAESINNTCNVENIEPEAFELLLSFVYAGKVPPDESCSFKKLYEAANFYEIKTLMQICKKKVHSELRLENAVEIFNWAHLFELDDIKKDAWVIINR